MIRDAIEQGGTEEQARSGPSSKARGGLTTLPNSLKTRSNGRSTALAGVPASAYRDALAALARFAVSRSS